MDEVKVKGVSAHRVRRCALLDELIAAWRELGNSSMQIQRRIAARAAIEVAWADPQPFSLAEFGVKPPPGYDAPKRKNPDHLSEFQEGQWWVRELDAMVKTGTVEQKRAVAVVHHMLSSAAELLAARAPQTPPAAHERPWPDGSPL